MTVRNLSVVPPLPLYVGRPAHQPATAGRNPILIEAQDVVREAYTWAWQRWRKVAAHPHPEGWLRVVVVRLATDRLRRMGGWQAVVNQSRPPDPARPPDEDGLMAGVPYEGG